MVPARAPSFTWFRWSYVLLAFRSNESTSGLRAWCR
jgi:hypothetical protein